MCLSQNLMLTSIKCQNKCVRVLLSPHFMHCINNSDVCSRGEFIEYCLYMNTSVCIRIHYSSATRYVIIKQLKAHKNMCKNYKIEGKLIYYLKQVTRDHHDQIIHACYACTPYNEMQSFDINIWWAHLVLKIL